MGIHGSRIQSTLHVGSKMLGNASKILAGISFQTGIQGIVSGSEIA